MLFTISVNPIDRSIHTGRLCFRVGSPSSAKLFDGMASGIGDGTLAGWTYGGMYKLIPETLPDTDRPPEAR